VVRACMVFHRGTWSGLILVRRHVAMDKATQWWTVGINKVRPAITEQPQTAPQMDHDEMCRRLRVSLGLGPDPTPSVTIDDAWVAGTSLTAAGTAGLGSSRALANAGKKLISPGITASSAVRSLTFITNAVGAAGIALSAAQSMQAFSDNNAPDGTISAIDATVGVLAFIPGGDAFALGYAVARVSGDASTGHLAKNPGDIFRIVNALSAAGCQ
jgi:hypothetical protein